MRRYLDKARISPTKYLEPQKSARSPLERLTSSTLELVPPRSEQKFSWWPFRE